jgi:hypothetical protein
VSGNVKEKTMRLPVRAAIVILLLFSGLFGTFAQETIAVHPLNDNTDTPMSAIFIEELIKAIPGVPGFAGVYRPYTIDLVNNRPADVPPGGFPPYICPSPSLTAGAAYAITTEIGENKDSPGEYWMRLYLWQMGTGRLLASDMINATDRASCAASYPYVLGYLYSIIDENNQLVVQSPGSPQQAEQSQTVYRPTSRPRPVQNWLNLGLHGGAGNSTWFDSATEITSSYLNVNAAFQVGVNLLSHLTIQAEANLNIHYDFASFDTNFWQMTVPLLFKFPFQYDPLKASIYLGPYLSFPLPMGKSPYDDTDFYKLLGISYGVSVGWKLGPGYFFIDGRFSHLLFFSDDGIKYPSNAAVFSIGYEIDIIRKRTRQQ